MNIAKEHLILEMEFIKKFRTFDLLLNYRWTAEEIWSLNAPTSEENSAPGEDGLTIRSLLAI